MMYNSITIIYSSIVNTLLQKGEGHHTWLTMGIHTLCDRLALYMILILNLTRDWYSLVVRLAPLCWCGQQMGNTNYHWWCDTDLDTDVDKNFGTVHCYFSFSVSFETTKFWNRTMICQIKQSFYSRFHFKFVW